MERWVLGFLVCMAIVCLGCGMQSAAPRTITISTEADAESVVESEKLPSSHGPLGRKHRAMQLVEEVFRSVESLRKADHFTGSELKTIAKQTRFSPAAVSGCDLEAVKIFVASNWAPVVILRSPVGPRHIRAVVGYDDSTERIALMDPVNYSQPELGYSEFSEQWDDPQKTCLLIFWQYADVGKIENALKKYLPEEKVDSIQIRTTRG